MTFEQTRQEDEIKENIVCISKNDIKLTCLGEYSMVTLYFDGSLHLTLLECRVIRTSPDVLAKLLTVSKCVKSE